jgi:GntR family transcriptional regulator
MSRQARGPAPLDPEGETPLYVQLAAILKRGIEDGTYPATRRIPSEPTLVATYGISQITARRAVRVLRDEGLVRSVKGRGVFVIDPSEAV